MPDMWVTCGLGPYNFEFMTEVTKEIVATYPEVGGIFSNRWEGSGMCYCEHCVRNFRDYCAWIFHGPTINASRRGETILSGARRAYLGFGDCGTARSASS